MGRTADNFRDRARHAAEEARRALSDDDGALQRKRQDALNHLAENEDWLDGQVVVRDQSGELKANPPKPSIKTRPISDEVRKENATEMAEGYAPKPIDSSVMYGLVGIGIAGLALFAFNRFYGFDFSLHPFLALLIIAAVCVGALVLRALRTRRHGRAWKTEYDKTEK